MKTWLAVVAGWMLVACAQAFRHEYFHRLADQLLAGVTELFLDCGVYRTNLSRCVQDEKAARSRLHG